MVKINVTKTFLPPIGKYEKYLEKIWASTQLTNQGTMLLKLEEELKKYLSIQNIQIVSSGTVALQLALNSLDITSGEIITSPFSYVATTSSILWERCQAVYVDIEPDTLCIDPSKIEAAITSKTRAIMPVHVFGNPCDVSAIEAIAKKHKLKVIYDAAHAFGVKYKGECLFNYGDISTCSFHATKIFHTVEGGCVIAKSDMVNSNLDIIKRFGHNFDEHIRLGINAKISELHAAMGLCNLTFIDSILENRRSKSELYDSLLNKTFRRQTIRENTEYNHSYYPIILDSETELLKAVERLNAQDIYPRRYFYPSLNTVPYLKSTQGCPVSEDISRRILCLPLYDDLDEIDIRRVCQILRP